MDKIILIDSKEPDYMEFLFEQKGYEVIKVPIKPSGDYAFGAIRYSEEKDNKWGIGEVLIERKTVEDFDGSFANNNTHLWDQLQRMQLYASDPAHALDGHLPDDEWGKGIYYDSSRCFYIIIGNEKINNINAGIDAKHRIGAFGSAWGRYPNVQMTFVSNEKLFVDLIDKLYRNYHAGKFGIGRDMQFKDKNYGSFDEYVLCGIPGIREQTADKILTEYDIEYKLTPKVPETKLTDIKSIGPKTAEKIRKELRL